MANGKESMATDKVLFCLTFFHSVLLLRGRLEHGLGWNAPCWFTESDFVCSAQLIRRWAMSQRLSRGHSESSGHGKGQNAGKSVVGGGGRGRGHKDNAMDTLHDADDAMDG